VVDDATPRLLHTAYLLFTISGLGLQLCVMVSTCLLAMVAPGLALRGPDGSMNLAVDSMISEYRIAFRRLLVGIIALHGSTITYVWLTLPAWQATLLMMCILCSLYMIIRYIRKIMRRFQLPASHAVTGKFEGREAHMAGADAGLRDRGEISTVSTLIQKETHTVGDLSELIGTAQRQDGFVGRPGAPNSPGGEIVE
jgi:hypothetical protein